jgi:hypothetical protein
MCGSLRGWGRCDVRRKVGCCLIVPEEDVEAYLSVTQGSAWVWGEYACFCIVGDVD